MIELRKLGRDNVQHAMMVVTESLEREAAAGERGEEFEEDWFEAHKKFARVALGGDYAGFVGYEGSTPVAVSLLSQTYAYDEGTGLFDWFYISPSVAASTFPLRLAAETIKAAKGLKAIVAFVGMGKDRIYRVLDHIGMKPVEVEFRGTIEDLPDKIKKRLE